MGLPMGLPSLTLPFILPGLEKFAFKTYRAGLFKHNEFGLTSRSPAHRNGVSSGVFQWKVGDNGETKQLEERTKGRISIMASDGR